MPLTRAEALKNFLEATAPADLAARYNDGMEVQVNVEQGTGEEVYDENLKIKPNTYSDGSDEWYAFRIPKNAMGDPIDNSGRPMTYLLEEHYEAIGITGWNFKLRRSIGVGFDFDSLVGHDPQRGRDAEQLARVVGAAKGLGYAEIRKSTSGTGYHLWVWFDPENLPETANHTEHSALARAVMLKMSHDTGFNFEADVDCLGGNMWICAKRATKENGGLTLFHAAEHPLTDWPQNWRDHLEVASRKRSRTRFKGPDSEDEADEIERTNQDRPRVPLDKQHCEFEQRYYETEYEGFWNEDHGCFVAHTYAIGLVFKQMGMRGVYETVSEGADPTKPNSWMYPLPHGAWRIFRFQKGTTEADTWETSPHGWTTCTINVTPTPKQVGSKYKGIVTPRSDGKSYTYFTNEDAQKAVAAYGGKLGLPEWLLAAPEPRPITLTLAKEGSGIDAEFSYVEGDTADGKELQARRLGWVRQYGGVWRKLIEVDAEPRQADYESLADNRVRLVTHNGSQQGLYGRTDGGDWVEQNTDRIRDYLTYKGIAGGLQKHLLGWCSACPWKMVAKPFAGEYPGNREWNLLGCKLLFEPAQNEGPTPHWDLILDHIGRGLDNAVEADPWCNEHGLKTGADYLRMWIANLIRVPSSRLPALAMYGEQNSGKSILQESIQLLFDESGFMFGDNALTNRSFFNGELEGKVLCPVEETNLAASPEAYTRLKAWITSHKITITYKRGTPFLADNYTHWIIACQPRDWIPIEPGDTRIIVWEVTPFEGREIPKPELLEELRKEAPFFVKQLYGFDLSGIYGRHVLPTLMTVEKAEAMKAVAARQDFPALEGTALKLAKAIQKLGKTLKKGRKWGPGNASELCEALGNWDGEEGVRELVRRANTAGRYLKRIQPYLAERGVRLDIGSGKAKYTVSALPQESPPATTRDQAADTPNADQPSPPFAPPLADAPDFATVPDAFVGM